MTGAEILLKTAVKAGVEICFTNPGTTELPLVAAFDTVPGIRPILGLFEGCCTGAADGFGRMTDKPAMTLLHLGPGLGNGIANLHNVQWSDSPDDEIHRPKAFDGFVEKEFIERAVELLRTEQKTALILGGVALRKRGLTAAARIKVKICSNRSYNILKIELSRSGITSPGRYAQTSTDLSNPAIDWVQISQGMGVPAVSVDSCEALAKELNYALDEPGPHLIEKVQGFSPPWPPARRSYASESATNKIISRPVSGSQK